MRNKTWLACAALAMVLACVPAGLATPISLPADPNAMQLYIQQTAVAANTQTQAALSTFTPSLTFTPTLRPSFTPESTITPFQTFVLPTPTASQRIQYFRVKHDSQLAVYNFKSRTAADTWELHPQTPEVIPLFAAPKEGTGTHRTRVDGAWGSYMEALNNHDEKVLRYLKGSATGLFNGSGFPQLESLTMGGNIITIEAIQNGWGRVHTMSYGNPGGHASDSYSTRPDLVHKFVVVGWSRAKKATYWVNPPQGDTYWPFVSGHDVWIQMDRLEPFPILPMAVIAKIEQAVMIDPNLDSKLTAVRLSVDDSVTINKYYPSGSDVWARLQSGGWILLFTYKGGVPTYLTSWSMATLPPPP